MPDSRHSQAIAESICYNCSAFIETEPSGKKVAKGNVTEVGIINHIVRSNIKAD